MTQECWNKHKVNILCKLGNLGYEIANKSKFSVSICKEKQQDLLMAAIMYEVICPFIFEDDETNYCLTDEMAENILIYIYNLLNDCNC